MENYYPFTLGDELKTIKSVLDSGVWNMSSDDGIHVKLEKANEYKDTLINKLRKHDLAKLSMQKPGLVEKKINRGTENLFRSLENLTGAPLPTPIIK